MGIVIFYAIAGVLLGLAATFYLVTEQLKKSNELGNSKGDRLTYTQSFDILRAKDNVRSNFDIDKAAALSEEITSYLSNT